MKKARLPAALAPDALHGKSKAYIGRALQRKESGNLDEYQLWASLALELLGKAVLAKMHPCLIADPTHQASIFAAARRVISLDIKTIQSKTLFERLNHLVTGFDATVKKFCEDISLRRNAELHSGDTPFAKMKLEAWEAQYWHATALLLGSVDLSLDDWLGSSKAGAPKAIVEHAVQAKLQAVVVRVRRAAEQFQERKKGERERALQDAATRESIHYKNLFTLLSDHEWECECPACGGKAFMAGIQVEEEVTDTQSDEYSAWEEVEVTYSGEQFRCPVCGLALDGANEIEATGLALEHSVSEEREMQYEPEYGND